MSEMRHTQLARLDRANDLIHAIAERGRRFFSVTRNGSRHVSRLELDRRGFVWFVDKYTNKRIYTHYAGSWRGFSEGGTLRGLVIALREYVKKGTKIRRILGPWPADYCGGDLWGYGESMREVRAIAQGLGIAELSSCHTSAGCDRSTVADRGAFGTLCTPCYDATRRALKIDDSVSVPQRRGHGGGAPKPCDGGSTPPRHTKKRDETTTNKETTSEQLTKPSPGVS